jgi:fructokinase
MPRSSTCIFGEVLLDRFPGGHRVPGGAPFNVAWHLSAFGEPAHLRSAVGDDAEGQEIRSAMIDWGMDISGLQTDPDCPTGEAAVTLADGEPGFEIPAERAFDRIREQRPPAGFDLLYHGSLALRSPQSAESLERLRAAAPKWVFMDANLRAPWWEREQVLALAGRADWVKLSRAELALLAGADPGQDPEPLALAFREAHDLTGLVVTLGPEGALGLLAGEAPIRVGPQAATDPLDPVGAGDAFSAVLILGIVRGWPFAQTVARAQAFAVRILGQRGATAADPGVYEPFIEDWGLAPL